MGMYIISFDGIDAANSTKISTEVSLDLDINSVGSAYNFLDQLRGAALQEAQGIDATVTRIANVRIHQLA